MSTGGCTEPELEQPSPRPIRRRVGRGGFFSLVHLFFVPHYTAAVFLTYIAVRDLAIAALISLCGQIVPGHVTDRQQSIGKKETSHFLHFAYQVGESEYSEVRYVDAGTFAGYPAGTAVQVKIFPLLPGLNPWLLVSGAASRWTDVGGIWFGCFIWDGIFGLALWHNYLLPWWRRSLVRDGAPTIGTILSKEEHRASFAIHYEYTVPVDRQGAVRQRTMKGRMPVWSFDYMLAFPGAEVTVLYHPRHPSRSVIYAFGDYEALPPAWPNMTTAKRLWVVWSARR